MDNLGNTPHNPDDLSKPIPLEDGSSAPVPAKTAPAGNPAAVSRSPLNLGGAGTGTAPHPTQPAAPSPPSPGPHPAPGPIAHPAASPVAHPAPGPGPHPATGPGPHPPAGPASGAVPAPAAPAMPKIQAPQPPLRKPVTTTSAPAGRITGCRTFFAKLHTGAIEFLDEQISIWLRDNPNIVVRFATTTTGEIQGKKTEPNILVTVWYSS
jgi:hypothetical protein